MPPRTDAASAIGNLCLDRYTAIDCCAWAFNRPLAKGKKTEEEERNRLVVRTAMAVTHLFTCHAEPQWLSSKELSHYMGYDGDTRSKQLINMYWSIERLICTRGNNPKYGNKLNFRGMQQTSHQKGLACQGLLGSLPFFSCHFFLVSF